MTKRKILYGYQIQNGMLTVLEKESIVVRQIATLYMEGLSYLKIAESLNGNSIPYSSEAPLWNKHKVKRLLENPRYTGADGYPAIIDSEVFRAIQHKIQSKTEGCVKTERRPALLLKEYLRCVCGGELQRTAGANRKKDMLYLKCGTCGKRFTISDTDLLSDISRQMARHNESTAESYIPSSEVIRLANAVNRALEHPKQPEDTAALILQGISARYDCCQLPAKEEPLQCPEKVDFKRFKQTVSYITISEENTITVYFK